MDSEPRHRKKSSALLAGGFFVLAGCGAAGGSGEAPEISYRLERPATGLLSNALLFDFPEDSGYEFQISTESALTADVEMDVRHPLQDRVDFTYAKAGDYELDLEIYQPNGNPYLQETLAWSFSKTTPEEPIVSFTEDATSDANITLLIAASREVETQEIWVEGDVSGKHANGGFWDDLPATNLYPMQVSTLDGLKILTVKLRNIYGNESTAVVASILKKSTTPTGCQAEMDGAGSASRVVRLRLFAVNDGPLFFAVEGDIDAVMDYQPFTNGETVSVRTTSGTGQKDLTVRIKDLAGNFCDAIEHTVALSGEYVQQTLGITGQPLWTEAATVDLDLRYDHFPSDGPIEMRITGAATGGNVASWIPYATTLTVGLPAGSGERKIFAQFRDKDQNESFIVSTTVFSRPTITLEDAVLPARTVILSDVEGLTHVTITGCDVAYNQVAYQAGYACNPDLGATEIDVLYTFDDATTLAKSAAL